MCFRTIKQMESAKFEDDVRGIRVRAIWVAYSAVRTSIFFDRFWVVTLLACNVHPL